MHCRPGDWLKTIQPCEDGLRWVTNPESFAGLSQFESRSEQVPPRGKRGDWPPTGGVSSSSEGLLLPAPVLARASQTATITSLVLSRLPTMSSLHTPRVNLALIGLGGVGSSTLSILQSSPALVSKFHLIGLANSSNTLLLTNPGIPTLPSSANPSRWLNEHSDASPLDLDGFVSKLAAVKGETIVVDNTSDEKVAGLYPTMLKLGLHVVTPNKKAGSGDLKLWEQIVAACEEKGSLYYGESTVGAGLPILTSLKDLVETGDEVVKIEGVLSGTRESSQNQNLSGRGREVGSASGTGALSCRFSRPNQHCPAASQLAFGGEAKLKERRNMFSCSRLPVLESGSGVHICRACRRFSPTLPARARVVDRVMRELTLALLRALVFQCRTSSTTTRPRRPSSPSRRSRPSSTPPSRSATRSLTLGTTCRVSTSPGSLPSSRDRSPRSRTHSRKGESNTVHSAIFSS